jgi:hypothetical protein
MAADQYDALNQNTRATGQWGKGKPLTFPPYPRPSTTAKTEPSERPKPTTVAELYRGYK